MPRLLALCLALCGPMAALARECGQAEIDAKDISGCVSVHHVKHMGHTNAVWVGEQLKNNTVLETLDLHHTFVGDDDAISLAAGLRGNTALHRLAMHNNYIRDAGARALGEALAENTGLRYLSLSSNGIADDGAVGLAEGIAANHGLRRLDLYFNLVSDKGAIAFAKAIKKNTALRQLNLDSNHIHDPGATSLAGALPEAAGLVELTLAYNDIKSDGAKVLARGARKSGSLSRLTLDHNPLINDATWAELQALQGELAERQRLSRWLVDAGLADHHVTSHEERAVEDHEPALLSPFAAPVKQLGAHTAAGLAELRHADAASLAAHAALAPLPPSDRDGLVEVLLRKVAEAYQRDEL